MNHCIQCGKEVQFKMCEDCLDELMKDAADPNKMTDEELEVMLNDIFSEDLF